MKITTLLMALLTVTPVFSQTNIYKFSGAYVRAQNADVSGEMSANELLNLDKAVRCPFPEFYFSTDKAYGVTNWSAFPGSSEKVGVEFRVGVSRRIDDRLYCSPWEYKYRFFIEWDKTHERPVFASAGGKSQGERCVRIGKPSILSSARGENYREWFIVHIDEIDTFASWAPAGEEQIKPVAQILRAIQTNDADGFLSAFTPAELEDAKKLGWKPARMLKMVKSALPDPFKAADCNIDEIAFSYTGTDQDGTVKFVYKEAGPLYRDIAKIGNVWKVGRRSLSPSKENLPLSKDPLPSNIWERVPTVIVPDPPKIITPSPWMFQAVQTGKSLFLRFSRELALPSFEQDILNELQSNSIHLSPLPIVEIYIPAEDPSVFESRRKGKLNGKESDFNQIGDPDPVLKVQVNFFLRTKAPQPSTSFRSGWDFSAKDIPDGCTKATLGFQGMIQDDGTPKKKRLDFLVETGSPSDIVSIEKNVIVIRVPLVDAFADFEGDKTEPFMKFPVPDMSLRLRPYNSNHFKPYVPEVISSKPRSK